MRWYFVRCFSKKSALSQGRIFWAAVILFALSGVPFSDKIEAEYQEVRNIISEPIPIAPQFWINSSTDYLARHLRLGIEGKVSVKLFVAIDGRTVSCSVTSSSGDASLDAHTCKLLMERATFQPGTDKDGNPIESTYSTAMDWKIH